MPTLTLKSGAAAEDRFEFDDTVVLGRGSKADYRLDDSRVSRQHARVEKLKHGYAITDLGSGNGTFVNKVLIKDSRVLREGDEVLIGGVSLKFSLKGGNANKSQVLVLDDIEDSVSSSGVLNKLDVDSAVHALTGSDHETDLSQRLRLMDEVSAAIAETLEEGKLLPLILSKIFEVFPQAERGAILLSSDEDEELQPEVARTRRGNKTEIRLSRSVLREVVESRAGVLSTDAMGDERFSAAATVHSLQLRSVVCVPMIAGEELYGVIHADSSDPTQVFTRDDMSLLMAIAGQAALFLANARLHGRLLSQELLRQDLALARRIQSSFLPDSLPAVPGWDFFADYRPALEVGGDYYDFIDLADGRLAVVVGDVSGKGVSAALYMAQLSSHMRYLAASCSEPTEILTRLSDKMSSAAEEGMFVTLVLLAVNRETGLVELANAGHNPTLAWSGGSVVPLETPENVPIGIDPKATFEARSFQLDIGDCVVLYTDGISEAHSARAEQFGERRLEKALADSSGAPGELGRTVLEAVDRFVGKASQHDDMTFVCFGRVSEAERSTAKP
ncbi:MAG: SpoIIE family protein phosphatase [Acidobacteriota bacterium]